MGGADTAVPATARGRATTIGRTGFLGRAPGFESFVRPGHTWPHRGGSTMTDARFRFATDILRRLGEELNPSLDHGVLELVKNAHDADASTCSVVLENVEAAGGTLCVTDDGCGMSLQDVVDHFLLLGKSPKDRMTRTGRGRIPAGSKGLGRLAALRAGRRVTMETRPGSDSSQEHVLRIDWRDFDHAAVVDDVPVSIETLGRRPGKGSAQK